MKLHELLDLHRAHYLDHFIAKLKALGDVPSEFMLDVDNKAPDEVHRLYRVDALRVEGDDFKMAEFNLAVPFVHAPFYEQRGEITIEILPFAWNSCTIEVLTDRIDRGAVIAWATHWIDVEDLRTPDEDGLRGVIHHITPPGYPLGRLTYWADFGTAPVQAVLELIKVLTVGAKSAKLTLKSL